MTLFWSRVFAFAVSLALVSLSGGARPADAQRGAAAEALFAVGMALNRGDVEAAVARFAPDGRVGSVTQGGQDFVGHEGIRAWATTLVDQRFHVLFDPNLADAGSRVTWTAWLSTDPWRDLGVAPVRVVVTSEVSDGLITTFDSVIDADSQVRLRLASEARAAVQALFAALNQNDLDATVQLFSEDAVLAGALGETARGQEQIRDYYSRLFSQHLSLSPIGAYRVTGDRVTVWYLVGLDSLREIGVPFAETMGDFYVRDGRVAYIQAAFTPTATAQIEAGA